jgi:hypothetical protein
MVRTMKTIANESLLMTEKLDEDGRELVNKFCEGVKL